MVNIWLMMVKIYIYNYLYIYIYVQYIYLVGGIPTPLNNMSSSVGMMTFPICGKMIKKCSKPPHLSTPFPKWPARGAERGHFRSKPRRCVRQRASLGPLKLHTSYVLSQGVSFAASLCRVYTVLPTVSATSVQRLRRHGNPMVSKLH